MSPPYDLVFKATNHEYNFYTKHKGTVSWREPVLRMSGLPFACTMADVQNFFESEHRCTQTNTLTPISSSTYAGIEIARNGIYITRDMSDKALGDGFVAFVNMENAFKAIDMHDQKHMQHRFDRTWSCEGKGTNESAATNSNKKARENETNRRENREGKIRGEVHASMVLLDRCQLEAMITASVYSAVYRMSARTCRAYHRSSADTCTLLYFILFTVHRVPRLADRTATGMTPPLVFLQVHRTVSVDVRRSETSDYERCSFQCQAVRRRER